MIRKLRDFGWQIVELALIAVTLCVLINIIAGPMAGSAVATIADNALKFLAALPAGTIIGVAALVILWKLLRRQFTP